MKDFGFFMRLLTGLILIAAVGLTAHGREKGDGDYGYAYTAPPATEVPKMVQSSPGRTTRMPVPDEYRRTYGSLEAALAGFEAKLKSSGRRKVNPVVFGAELAPAHSNRGKDLLGPTAGEEVVRYLCRLKEIGVQGVTVPVGYPLYTPGFPEYGKYVAFYRQVAREVRARDMKLCVEAHVIPANTPLTGVRVNYGALTLARYRMEKKEMVAAIVRDMKPDYLDIGSEPDTEARLTGLRELDEPAKYTEYLRYVLDGLGRGSTKIAAGVGTWGNPAFAGSIARFTGIDVLAVHLYPVTERTVENALAIADIARTHHKGLVLDEAWLLKSDRYRGGGTAAWAEMFRRDGFRFWTPLDQKFLSLAAKFARTHGVEYMSPSRTGCFFSYMDYGEKNADLPYRDMGALRDKAVLTSIAEGTRTTTGEYYRILIELNSK